MFVLVATVLLAPRNGTSSVVKVYDAAWAVER
jgi:hypothetical protein